MAQWRLIDAALSPVIGSRGVQAMVQRCLFLCQPLHPCLATAARVAGESPQEVISALHEALLACEPAEALAADQALHQTFTTLLGKLIGSALTERLIGFAHEPSSPVTPAPDTSASGTAP